MFSWEFVNSFNVESFLDISYKTRSVAPPPPFFSLRKDTFHNSNIGTHSFSLICHSLHLSNFNLLPYYTCNIINPTNMYLYILFFFQINYFLTCVYMINNTTRLGTYVRTGLILFSSFFCPWPRSKINLLLGTLILCISNYCNLS